MAVAVAVQWQFSGSGTDGGVTGQWTVDSGGRRGRTLTWAGEGVGWRVAGQGKHTDVGRGGSLLDSGGAGSDSSGEGIVGWTVAASHGGLGRAGPVCGCLCQMRRTAASGHTPPAPSHYIGRVEPTRHRTRHCPAGKIAELGLT